MSGSRSYAIGPGWNGLLAQIGVDSADVLRRAHLPEDLLTRDNVRISAETLFRLNEALDASVPDQGFWVQLTDAISPEWFTPPMFAALCSPDLATAAERLALFKPLIGPINLDVHDGSDGLELSYRWNNAALRPPRFMNALEALFIVKLARLGTRQRISPTAVIVPELPDDAALYEDYLGVRLQQGESIRVSFSTADAHQPFMTSNPAMWRIFEPELRKRLADLEGDATFTQRTQAVLLEALPSGQFAMDTVARRLAVSSRTLQRRLREEDTNFKAVVGATRERLARHYLRQPHITSTEIAYLIGFEEPTSFFRAFQRWTGTTPETLRQQLLGTSAGTAAGIPDHSPTLTTV